MFVDGEYLEYTFPTEPEPLSVIAQVVIHGDTLEMRDVAVFCGPGRQRVPIGVSALLKLLRDTELLVAASGFAWLVITGDRHTGASPGREVFLRRRLQ